VAAAIAAAIAPWWSMLHVLPWGADATNWVARANPSGDWVHWVFDRKHFVGYRPVTALTYLLNNVVTGYEAWGYRSTDLALHGVSLALVLALHRRWFGRELAGAAVTALVVLGHPVLAEVVPHTARRSYLLATDFGLLGLLLHDRALAAPTSRNAAPWSVTAGLSLLLAILSNEIAYALLPLVAIQTVLQRWRSALLVLPTVAAGGLGVFLRWRVLESVGGGYQRRYFALQNATGTGWLELPDWQPRRIATAAVRYLFTPFGADGSGPVLPEGEGRDLVVVVGVAWVLAVGLALPARRWSDPSSRTRLALVAWLAGSLAIVVLSQTWFWRQAHAPLFPLALLAGAAVTEAVRSRTAVTLLAGGGALAVLGLALPYGPLLGADLHEHVGDRRGTRLVERVEAAGIEGPATVWLAVGEHAHATQIARVWLDLRGARHGLHHRVFANLTTSGDPERARLRLTQDGDTRLLRLGRSMDVRHTGADALIGEGKVRIDGLWRPPGPNQRRSWLVVSDRDGVQALELFRPADGVLVRDGPDEPLPE
jgi:hypothetical protein